MTSGSYQTSLDSDRYLREGAVVGSVEARGQVAVSGRDRASFLQGLLTNDVQALAAGTGCYSAWLTPQGRMLTDVYVFESGEMMLLDLPASEVQPTLERLDRFLFSEDVQFNDLSSSLRAVWLHGPVAPALLVRVVQGVEQLDTWVQCQHARATYDGAPVVIARIDQLGVPGFCVFVPPDLAGRLKASFIAAGAHAAEPGDLEAARVAAGLPLFGVDMTEDTIPLEAGIESRAISFSKGCYVGQEVVIRILHRGHGRVARRLVGLRIGGQVPAAGARLFSGEREIGVITSSAQSARLGAIALGYVGRDFSAPGTAVEVEDQGGRRDVVVTDRPIPPAA